MANTEELNEELIRDLLVVRGVNLEEGRNCFEGKYTNFRRAPSGGFTGQQEVTAPLCVLT